ncbi:hypothetical protein Goklo_020781 [Gossypium klotzschianum]|uniref:Uncharacterized protein n=1 Tax=Gossypium klotzschianum TaxID=34286 RepID=A0A7J8USX6_9ROSI|nr:hypothetical protein [Gossypium klotzschianum]
MLEIGVQFATNYYTRCQTSLMVSG